MTVYIDKKYISLLSTKLKNFKQRGEFLWNFRCPVCGDSQKDKTKTRGYIYRRKERFSFMCHNCSSSMSLHRFIKHVDPALYNEYQLESFVNTNTTNSIKVTDFVTNPTFDKPAVTKSIKDTDAIAIGDLSSYHPARVYIDNRRITTDGIYYVEDFAKFVKDLFPDNTKQLYKEERIIIPFYDKDGNLVGVQGRSLGPSKIKYITIKSSEDIPKVFGWNTVDVSKRIYVLEGPIDSLFIHNAIASMDANLMAVTRFLGHDNDYVFVFDNEPRSKPITNNIKKTIDMGHKVCIWPSDILEKDVNEMVLAGKHPSEIQHIIDNNTYEGLMATMKLNQWSKL